MIKTAETGLANRPATHTLVAQSEQLPDHIQQVVLTGDLGQLAPNERAMYYLHVCKSVGVNPATRPFEFTVLNGKTVLYAKRDCTDQLRYNKNVSVQIVSREQINDLYAVTARATIPDGRTDEAIGVVAFGNLKGNDAANALMKAETKAKRRVTLSICGLGFTDETELETIPGRRDLPDTAVANVGVRRVENESTTPEPSTRPSAPASAAGEAAPASAAAGSGTASEKIEGTPASLGEAFKATVFKWAGVTGTDDKRHAFHAVYDKCGVTRPAKKGDTPESEIERMLDWCHERMRKSVDFFEAVKVQPEPVDEAPKAPKADPEQERDAVSAERRCWPQPAKASPAQVAYWRRQLVQQVGLWKQTASKDDHQNATPEELVRNFEAIELLPVPGDMTEQEAAMRYKAVVGGPAIEWSKYITPF
jgi:hypothetical protein